MITKDSRRVMLLLLVNAILAGIFAGLDKPMDTAPKIGMALIVIMASYALFQFGVKQTVIIIATFAFTISCLLIVTHRHDSGLADGQYFFTAICWTVSFIFISALESLAVLIVFCIKNYARFA